MGDVKPHALIGLSAAGGCSNTGVGCRCVPWHGANPLPVLPGVLGNTPWLPRSCPLCPAHTRACFAAAPQHAQVRPGRSPSSSG